MRPAALFVLLAALIVPASAVAAPASVTVEDDAFSPASVTINAGESVTWNFREGGHNVDVYDGPETFKSTSDKNDGNSTFAKTFSKAGTYKYLCDYHGDMTGTVSVKEVPASSPPPSGGGSSSGGSTGTAPAPSGDAGTSTEAGQAPAGAQGGTSPSSSSRTPAAGAVDSAAPALRSLGYSDNLLMLRVSERSRLLVSFKRVGDNKIRDRITRVKPGTVVLRLRRWMRPGRYRVTVIALDADGNVSRPVRKTVTVRRPPR